MNSCENLVAELQQARLALQREIFEHQKTREELRRKTAEEDPLQSDEHFQLLANHVTDAFWVRTADMSQVLYVSPAFERIWGRSVQELLAQPHCWVDFIYPEDKPRVQQAFAKLQSDAPTTDIEYRIVRPDGETRWIRARGFQVRNSKGQLVRLAGIISDITERRILETQMLQTQKLETVGRLAGGIAHEFNNILSSILGHCDLLIQDLPPGESEAESVQAIHKAALRAAKLTHQMRAYGRRQFLQPKLMSLNDLVKSLEGLIRNAMGSKVTTHLQLQPDLPKVKADVAQLEQVVINIAINSRDAMPQGGNLTLNTQTQQIDNTHPELKPGNYVTLTIQDNGNGMTPEVRERAFEPFFTTKGVGQGTGLGLSSCYGVLKQSGGHLALTSQQGFGTSVTLFLPTVVEVSCPD